MKLLDQETKEKLIYLRSRGMSFGQIKELTGFHKSTVARITDPKAREKQNAWARKSKRNRHGVCVDCGGQTNYSGTTGVCLRCEPCARRRAGINARGRGPRMSKALELLSDGQEHRWLEIKTHTGSTNSQMGPLLARLMKYGFIERRRWGIYVKP